MDKSKYFYRITVFTHHTGDVALVNVRQGNQLHPLNDWLGSIVSLADGQHTIENFVDYISGQYPSGAPDDLETHIESLFQHLIDIQAIRLCNDPVEMPYYLSIPAEEQDIEKAKQLMLEDGYI